VASAAETGFYSMRNRSAKWAQLTSLTHILLLQIFYLEESVTDTGYGTFASAFEYSPAQIRPDAMINKPITMLSLRKKSTRLNKKLTSRSFGMISFWFKRANFTQFFRECS